MSKAYQELMRNYAARLRADDQVATTFRGWHQREGNLHQRILAAIGPMPETPCPLEPQILGELKRPGYVIEKLTFQSRPDVWVTANVYRSDPAPAKGPAVLVVHGHWALARIDPVIQAGCLGLVKLGFTVLCVDAFGSGERYIAPAAGTYHGAFYGGPLWPVGQTLLGMQLYDNRRAVDYLVSRPEVDPARLGVTGSSGGGNQSMYAGAFDNRLQAVVPVCSVGNFQSYLLVACCICEVIPRALEFTEEGDVLGLIAPRKLLVINAAKDSVQFSPAEAEKSLHRAREIYKLHGVDDHIAHRVVDAGHGYDQSMREAMYGWMTRWLKNEGAGAPIAEPKFTVEDPTALKCYPDLKQRPSSWLFPPSFANKAGRAMLAKQFPKTPTHAEEWTSTAITARMELREVLGVLPATPQPTGTIGVTTTAGQTTTTQVTLPGEPGLPIAMSYQHIYMQPQRPKAAVVLAFDEVVATCNHALTKSLVKAGWSVAVPRLRLAELKTTSKTRPADYGQAEHGVWVGRPLLGQWVWEVQWVIDWLRTQPIDREKIHVVGIGSASIVGLVVAGLAGTDLAGLVTTQLPSSFLTDEAYGPNWRMGLLAPGIIKAGDIPHLAGLVAPRTLIISDGVDPQGQRLKESKLQDAFAFTSSVYQSVKSARLSIVTEPDWDEVVRKL